jgi:hypothetical protein
MLASHSSQHLESGQSRVGESPSIQTDLIPL